MTEVDLDVVNLIKSVFSDFSPLTPSPDWHGFDKTTWKTLETTGLSQLATPVDLGGSGATVLEFAALLKEAAAKGAQFPLVEHDLLAGGLREAGSIPARGGISTVCMVEDVTQPVSVPWARFADVIVVLWRDHDKWRVSEVAAAESEISVGSNIAGEPRDRVAFDPSTLGGNVVDDRVVDDFFLRGALARGIQICGAMNRITQACVEFTKQRTQFGRSLSAFQAVQHLVADVAAEAALAEAAVDSAVAEAANGHWSSPALRFKIAAARSCSGHAASVVVRNAHQVHGAIGTTREHELHSLTRPVLAWRSEFGSVHHWDQVLTDAVLATPSSLWSLITSTDGAPNED